MEEKKEIVVFEDMGTIEIAETELPDVISEQFRSIVEIDKQLVLAEEKCIAARVLAEKQVSAKATSKTEAITSTQNTVRSIVDAQASLAEAQKLLFDNQQKMAAGMRYLLILGSSSIAMNRVVIAELEGKLKQASEEELSQASREELLGVIKLLREQESAFSKQDRMSEQLSETTKMVKLHGEEIVGIKEVDKRQTEKDVEHDGLIAKNVLKNIEQDNEIQRQKKVDESHDVLLKQIKKLATVGVVIATAALILSIISLVC